MEVLELLQEPWAVRALVASSMVGIMCGLLGCFIVLRNMALIGDALSHAILPGVVVAFLLVGQANAFGFFLGAVAAGLVCAVAITWIQQNVKTKNDAAIGIVFTAMFSLGVIGISKISRRPGVHLDLKDFLFGNVLGIHDQDLYLTIGVTLYVVLCIVVFYRYLFISTFQPVIAQTMGISVNAIHYFLMLLLSFAVVASLQTVGVILVVAMLITPAATALLLAKRLQMVLLLAALVGLLSAVVGLVASIQWDTAPGPAMAVVATVFYLLAALLAPEKGLVSKQLQKRRLQRRIQLEDALKQAFRLQEQGRLSAQTLAEKLDASSAKVNKTLQALRRKGWMHPREWSLTEGGMNEARRLVRAHRLWETYLAEKLGLDAELIHQDAEKYEHLLSEEMLDEVDQSLGFPAQDPHGSPIPVKPGEAPNPLSKLGVRERGRIAGRQPSEWVGSKLWQLGLLPETEVEVVALLENEVEIAYDGRRL
ncbi:MAG: hypothetical protein D6765_08425, partial [Bacteroidetes bacterium]